jgi:phosphatidylinositol-3-phosphatase
VLSFLAAFIDRIRRSVSPKRALLVAAAVLVAIAAVVAIALSRTTTAPARVPRFTRVVVIVFENHEYGQIIGNPAAPSFNSLASRYALLTNYYAVAHPSLPNYVAMISGSTQGITSDCTSCRVDALNLADSLESAHKSWKVYAEGLPSPGFTGAGSGLYAKKHVPFLYFQDVLQNPSRLRRIVPLPSFAGDLRARKLPDFSLIVPNLCHDMHYCPVSTGDAWLGTFLPSLLASPELKGGVVFVAFDEGVDADTAHGGGHVPVIVAGPLVRRGVRATGILDHYGLLRTIEQSWRLPLLGKSRSAAPITGIWR